MKYVVSPRSLVLVGVVVSLFVVSLFITKQPTWRGTCLRPECQRNGALQTRRPDVDAVLSTWVPGRVSETMTVAFVVCGVQLHIALVAIKSVIAYSTSPLNLTIVVDEQSEARLSEEVASWPAVIKERVHVQLKPVWRPSNGDSTFAECAAQQLYFPSMLPDVDALVYVSTGAVFLHPVEDFWRMFFAMNDQQMVGVAPGLETIHSGLYLRISGRPLPEPLGVNSDVLLMNLTRMRTFGLERRIAEITRENENFTVNAVQDALNILLARHPEAIFTFTCRWNYRAEHCYKDALCTDGPVAVVHGSYDTFMYRSPAFMALHITMRQYDLGQSLLRGFIDPLKQALAIQAWDGCHVEFVRQLEHWRLSAHRVDVVSNRTSL